MKKSTLATLALACSSALFTILIAEIALRLAGISYPLFTKADEWTGFALRPGAAGWVQDEGRAYVSINTWGMRDTPRSKEKPSDTIRIAVLGDSYTEARQVSREQAYPAILEQELKTCPAVGGKKIEVLNFGVSGFGTAQELLQLRHRVWDFSPDVVALEFTTGNDIRNNSFALEGSKDKPYFRLQGQSVEEDLSFRDNANYRKQTSLRSRLLQSILSHSRILQIAYRAMKHLSAPKAAPPTPSTGTGTMIGTEAGLDTKIYKEPDTPEWKEAWILTERLLTQMNREVKEKGARFAVMTITNGAQVQPDAAARAKFAQSIGAADLLYPDHRIASIGAAQGFPVLELAPIFQKAATDRNVYFHGFPETGLGQGHWNAEGHALAGKELAHFLCQQGL